jgi:hypothetical protein
MKLKIPLTEIHTMKDVKTFTNQLGEIVGLGWHPDTDFKDYTNGKETTFDESEAERLNDLMEDAFKICQNEDEIYNLAFESTKSIRHQLGIGVDYES